MEAASSIPNPRNYLRVRGEYRRGMREREAAGELPPRARRIHCAVVRRHECLGTTSACAENTLVLPAMLFPARNYLRVRGEYIFPAVCIIGNLELPPRARRIPPIAPSGTLNNGTTSACAENTCYVASCTTHTWNYLRVRGEYPGQTP